MDASAPARGWSLLRRAGTAALLGLAVVVPGASAAWTPPQTLSPSTPYATQPHVAVGGNGDAVAVYLRGDGLTPRVEYLVRHGSTWSSVAFLTAEGVEADDPHVAMDDAGNALVVYRRLVAGKWAIEGRLRSPDGTLGPAQRFSDPGQDAAEPRVAFDGSGDAVVAWRRSDGFTDRLQTRVRSAAGVLGPTATLSSVGDDAEAPSLAVDDAGDAVIAWQLSGGGVQARQRLADGTVGPKLAISTAGRPAQQPQVTRNQNGQGGIAWTENDGTSWIVRSRRFDDAFTLSGARTASQPGRDALDPQIGVDGVGNIVVAWRRHTANIYWSVQTEAEAADGSSTNGLRTMSYSEEDALDPVLAVDVGGRALLAWRRFDGTRFVLQSRERALDGTVSGVRSNSPSGQDAADPRIGANRFGAAVIAWRPTTDSTQNFVKGIWARTRRSDLTYQPVGQLDGTVHAAREVQVAVAPNGVATYVWKRQDGTGFRIEGRRRAADGTLGPIVQFGGADLDQTYLGVTVDAAGNALVTFNRLLSAGGPSGYPGVQARAWNADGTIGPVQTVDGAGRRAVVTRAPDGTAYFVYEKVLNNASVIGGRQRNADGTYLPPDTVCAGCDQPRVARMANGATGIVWQSFSNAGNFPIRARFRQTNGTFSAPATIVVTGSAQRPSIAALPNGSAVVTWDFQEPGTYRAQTRDLAQDGTLSPITTLSDPDPNVYGYSVRAVARSDGSVVFGWLSQDENVTFHPPFVAALVRSPGGTYGSRMQLSRQDWFVEGGYDLAVDAQNRVTFVWALITESFLHGVQTRTVLADGSLTPEVTLSFEHLDATGGVVAGGPNGALIGWVGLDGPLTRTPRAFTSAGP